MAAVDTALLLLCRSHQAHSVDNRTLASLLLCLSSTFSWYRKAQLDRFPCVASGTRAEEQPSRLNCSYLQQKKKKGGGKFWWNAFLALTSPRNTVSCVTRVWIRVLTLGTSFAFLIPLWKEEWSFSWANSARVYKRWGGGLGGVGKPV